MGVITAAPTAQPERKSKRKKGPDTEPKTKPKQKKSKLTKKSSEVETASDSAPKPLPVAPSTTDTKEAMKKGTFDKKKVAIKPSSKVQKKISSSSESAHRERSSKEDSSEEDSSEVSRAKQAEERFRIVQKEVTVEQQKIVPSPATLEESSSGTWTNSLEHAALRKKTQVAHQKSSNLRFLNKHLS
ncbi:PREDICTED: uncharacterized protein LOC109153928 [Ipomoea nil]|uniref:uncharacterized protein LOC109153928 n=1 Tax=Ipomoea nil TaxID=35883 RepID=UPI0009018B9C|nr:PREDICTED: uncharacterized protein LOC109153928 [Ipomoea nil]